MKKTITAIFILLFLFVCAYCNMSLHAFAAEKRTIDLNKLSLKDCVDLAIVGNYQIKTQREDLLQSIANLRVTKNLSNPSVSTSNTFGQTTGTKQSQQQVQFNLLQDLNTGDAITITNTDYTQSTGNKSLLYNQFSIQWVKPLLKGGGLAAGNYNISTAERSLQSQNLTYELARQDLIKSALTAYYAVIRAKNQIIVNEEAVKLAQESYRIASRKIVEGLATSIDVTRAETTLTSAQSNLIESQKTWKKALDDLAVLMGFAPQTPIDIDYRYSYIPLERAPDENSLIKDAMNKRMELAKRNIELDQKYIDLKYYQNQFMPTVNLTTAYNTNPLSSSLGTSQSYDLPTWSLNLVSTYYLRDFSNEENLKKGKRLVDLKKEDITNYKNTIEDEVRASIRDITSAEKQVDVNKENVKAAELSLYAANRRWEEGIADNRDVLDAQQALRQARTSLYNAQVNYLTSKANLLRNTGADLYEYIQKEF